MMFLQKKAFKLRNVLFHTLGKRCIPKSENSIESFDLTYLNDVFDLFLQLPFVGINLQMTAQVTAMRILVSGL